jgi:hypothetical protein
VCDGVEKKMGLHAAPTTTLNFGSNDQCIGYLCGFENQGLEHMFQMMNQARINSGVSGMTLASTAYLNALDYCKGRIQGVDIAKRKKGSVPIIDHPDIRRMLLWMKAVVEGLRSMIYLGAFYSDLAHCETDETKKQRYDLLLELMTPIIKAYSSHMGFEVCSTAMQCFGGHGYMSGYPVEMYLRDVRAPALYEGTNGIQSIDLTRRKMGMKNGAALRIFLEELYKFINMNRGRPGFEEEVRQFSETVDQLREVSRQISENWQSEPLRAASHAFPLMLCFGDVTVAWRLLDMAAIADEALSKGTAKQDFYRGKILSARYFIKTKLPETKTRLKACMEDRHEIVDLTNSEF